MGRLFLHPGTTRPSASGSPTELVRTFPSFLDTVDVSVRKMRRFEVELLLTVSGCSSVASQW